MAITSRVFIIQDQFVRDQETNAPVSKFNFTTAKEYGELHFLLQPTANPFSPNEGVVAELTDKLHDFSNSDYLVLTGNPILIGWATAIAAKVNKGKVKFLQWNGRRGLYLEIRGDIFNFF
jgi:hypothetical protein